jgi:putative PIN family toxin of toxin-antitoxin system
MLRVVADTNIFISALMFGGLPGSFLDLAFLRSFVLVTSPTLLDELDEKLRRKFEVSPEDAGLIRARLENCALVVTPGIVLEVIKDDPDDDRVLECAVAGEAEYIVSGDKHLLRLGSYQGISIVTARDFMDAIEAGA